jgi:hypothetical protein
VVGGFLWATSGLQVAPDQLAVGDCLYVRVPAGSSETQVIGSPDVVRAVLLSGGAERASCTASHGHEVSARVEVPAVPPLPSGVSVLPTVLAEATVACDNAFAGYVGKALADSLYESIAVVPATFETSADVICLVARRDGQWMDHPARGSGE